MRGMRGREDSEKDPPARANFGTCTKGHPKDSTCVVTRTRSDGSTWRQRKYYCSICNAASVRRQYNGYQSVKVSKMLIADMVANAEGRPLDREAGRLITLALALERSKRTHPRKQ